MSTARAMPNWLTTCFAEQNANPVWLRELQQQQGEAFLQRGIPSRREEHWKYTDVSFLAQQTFNKSVALKKPHTIDLPNLKDVASIRIVLVNGHMVEALSDLKLLPKEVVLSSLKQMLLTPNDLLQQHCNKAANLQRYPFAALNMALMEDGIFLSVPKNCQVTAPIHLVYLNTLANNYVSCPRNIIVAGENSEVVILEEHLSEQAQDYFVNMVTDISAASYARIHYYKIQNESLHATHIAQTFVEQKDHSVLNMCTLSLGAKLAREDIFVKLTERGAESSVNGFYALHHDHQHIDNHIQIDHIAPLGTSNMIYKGTVDKKARAVFNGKIHVHPDAQKTQSHQKNHNLLLSPDAAVDTKPELEIYADDVKCAHGDTVGQLDQDILFYLRSRGLDEKSAIQLLIHAYSAEVFEKIAHPAIKQRMNAILREKQP